MFALGLCSKFRSGIGKYGQGQSLALAGEDRDRVWHWQVRIGTESGIGRYG